MRRPVKKRHFNPIITSFLDTDLYKFTMAQVVFFKYPHAMVNYAFKSRGGTIFPKNCDKLEFLNELKRQIVHYCSLEIRLDEFRFLKNVRFFHPSFVEFLRNFRLNHEHIHAYIDDDDELAIDIAGPWWATIWFEVPILAIISELHHRFSVSDDEHFDLIKESANRLTEKIMYVKEMPTNFKISDLGTRRRLSHHWHDRALFKLKYDLPHHFMGTSNVYFAHKYNLKMFGTMAHEYITAHQQLGGSIIDSQKNAFQTWADVYRGDLGIALSDTYGNDAFFRDFDRYFALLFEGARHDSGDPLVWGDRLIKHYESMNIDPRTKIATFSDGLDVEKSFVIWKDLYRFIQCRFGIGTNLTNDHGGNPLKIVIKMIKCQGKSVSKISNDPGKEMGDAEHTAYLKTIFNGK